MIAQKKIPEAFNILFLIQKKTDFFALNQRENNRKSFCCFLIVTFFPSYVGFGHNKESKMYEITSFLPGIISDQKDARFEKKAADVCFCVVAIITSYIRKQAQNSQKKIINLVPSQREKMATIRSEIRPTREKKTIMEHKMKMNMRKKNSNAPRKQMLPLQTETTIITVFIISLVFFCYFIHNVLATQYFLCNFFSSLFVFA